jgi:hypothetical protein
MKHTLLTSFAAFALLNGGITLLRHRCLTAPVMSEMKMECFCFAAHLEVAHCTDNLPATRTLGEKGGGSS